MGEGGWHRKVGPKICLSFVHGQNFSRGPAYFLITRLGNKAAGSTGCAACLSRPFPSVLSRPTCCPSFVSVRAVLSRPSRKPSKLQVRYKKVSLTEVFNPNKQQDVTNMSRKRSFAWTSPRLKFLTILLLRGSATE